MQEAKKQFSIFAGGKMNMEQCDKGTASTQDRKLDRNLERKIMRPTERFTKCHMQVESVHESLRKFDNFLNQFKKKRRASSVPKNMREKDNLQEKENLLGGRRNTKRKNSFSMTSAEIKRNELRKSRNDISPQLSLRLEDSEKSNKLAQKIISKESNMVGQ